MGGGRRTTLRLATGALLAGIVWASAHYVSSWLGAIVAFVELTKAGAFDLTESHLFLALEGNSVDPVRVTAIRSHVRTRLDPLSGAASSLASCFATNAGANGRRSCP
jgi:hypothetical protein